MILVVVESPFKAVTSVEVSRNVSYAQLAMKDCLDRNEAPFVSHLLYTQVLDDGDCWQRILGIQAGLEWGAKADKTVVYCDYGISEGMQEGIKNAKRKGRKIEYRKILTPKKNVEQ